VNIFEPATLLRTLDRLRKDFLFIYVTGTRGADAARPYRPHQLAAAVDSLHTEEFASGGMTFLPSSPSVVGAE
jgi:hypothetical protein